MSTWILLRGWTREAAHWGAFPGQLAAVLPGDAVIALDLPGTGSEHRRSSPTCIAAIAEDCRARLERRGVAPPYRLFGLSLGGMVAAHWAARHAHEIERAVLLNTSLRPYAPPWRRLRPRAWPGLLRIAATRDPRAAEQAILELTSALAGERAALVDAWVAIRARRPVRPRNALGQLVAALRYRASAVPPAVPLLLLASAADQLVHPDCSRSLARAWGGTIAEHPHAGHDLPLDDGPWVAECIAAWIAAVPGNK